MQPALVSACKLMTKALIKLSHACAGACEQEWSACQTWGGTTGYPTERVSAYVD